MNSNKLTYDKILQNTLTNITDTIVKISEDLRCCGNCLNFKPHSGCQLNLQDHFTVPLPFRFCNEWHYDGLTKEERMINLKE